MAKAKANAAQAIPEMIEIASNGIFEENRKSKIAAILSEKAFTLSVPQYIGIHKRLFAGIYSHAGNIRDFVTVQNLRFFSLRKPHSWEIRFAKNGAYAYAAFRIRPTTA